MPYTHSIAIIRIKTRPNSQLAHVRRQGLPRALEYAESALAIVPHDGGDGIWIAHGASAWQYKPLANTHTSLSIGREAICDAVGSLVAEIAAADQCSAVTASLDPCKGGNIAVI